MRIAPAAWVQALLADAGSAPLGRQPAASESTRLTGKVVSVMNPSLIQLLHADAYQADRTSRRRFRTFRR